MEKNKSKPLAVLISDIHYSIQTLQLADAAMRMAIDLANSKDLHLVVAGDLHDTKANMRGECVNAMLETFSLSRTRPSVLVGNHDKINERADENSLNFLSRYCDIVSSAYLDLNIGCYFIPYHHDPAQLEALLAIIPKGSRIICHQGVQQGNAGHYIHDKSALPKSCFADFRVISGHFHTRQTIKCGRPRKGAVGAFDYIGNPYTLNFAEANDPEKGFQVLYSDGTLEFVPTNLRRHIVVEKRVEELNEIEHITVHHVDDIIQVKVSGTPEQLAVLTKDKVATALGISNSFRLDLIPTENESKPTSQAKNQSQPELLDCLIDTISNASTEQKDRLKNLWKGL